MLQVDNVSARARGGNVWQRNEPQRLHLMSVRPLPHQTGKQGQKAPFIHLREPKQQSLLGVRCTRAENASPTYSVGVCRTVSVEFYIT